MMDDEFETAQRELCPDDACIGLIGPDGRCKVCGTVGASAVADPRHRGMKPPGQANGAAESELDHDRELCPDDACIGVIGPDGRCKECGTRGRGAAAGAAVAPPKPEAAPVVSGEEEEDDRELCPDALCIGLIGSDGRCKVCGTGRAPASP